MTIHLTKKQRNILAIFLSTDNRALSMNEIHTELMKQHIVVSKRTVKNTLTDYNQFNKRGNTSLIIKNLDKTGGGVCFILNENVETFIELARNLLHAKEFVSLFFRSKFTQRFLDSGECMSHIERNLNVEFDKLTREKIHQIIHNSPSALYFGLFAKDLKSQKIKDASKIPEDAEHEIRENFISRLLDDLREKDFYLSPDVEKLEITIESLWKYKRKKNTEVELKLTYIQ